MRGLINNTNSIVHKHYCFHINNKNIYLLGELQPPQAELLFFFSTLSFRALRSNLLTTIARLRYDNFYKISWFRIVLFAGLGYKRRLWAQKRYMCTYIADRHWIIYKFSPSSITIPVKRRNFIFLSKNKLDFNQDYYFFSTLRRPYIYKMKGFLDKRIKRRFLFVRRIKFRGIKTKLSKKQQLL